MAKPCPNPQGTADDAKEFASGATALERRWYAAYTKPCHEKRVTKYLDVSNIESFLPLYRTSRRWNNRCTVSLERPLFPNYVFVHIEPKERMRVLDLSGVLSIVGSARRPMPLPNDEIERLRSGLHLLHAEPHPVLTIGERVRVRRGPLEGMTGILTQKKNGFWVVLTVELIMKSVAVEVSTSDIEPISPLTLVGRAWQGNEYGTN